MSDVHKLGGTRCGFTLVELLVVLVVLAVVSAIVLPRFAQSSRRSKIAKVRSDLRLLRGAVERFRADTGVVPVSLAALAAESAPAKGLDAGGKVVSINASDWRGPYIDSVPRDPLAGKPYFYVTTPPNVGFVTAGDSASAQNTAGSN